MHFINNRLVLGGVPERGVLYAVMDFLERDLGCRWYASDCERIPIGRKLNLNVESRREEPSFAIRSPYVRGTAIWNAANRSTNTTGIWGNNPFAGNNNPHSLFKIVSPQKYFKDHPTWFTCQNGVWFDEGQINYHNEEVIDLVSRRVIEDLTRHPKWVNYWISQADILGWSQDPVSNAFDGKENSTAASHMYFVNKIADAVRAAHPDRHIMTLAYHYTLTPPQSLRYASNVTLFICTPWVFSGTAITDSGVIGRYYLDMVRRWAKRCDTPMVWMYHMDGHYRALSPYLSSLQTDYKALHDAGIKGVFAELGKLKSPTGDLKLYMLMRLWWNVDLDMKKLLRDFHYGYYGKAAGEKMLEYYYALSACRKSDSERLKRMGQFERILTDAYKLADTDFARKRIASTLAMILSYQIEDLSTPWDYRDGYISNVADLKSPAVKSLFKRIKSLDAEANKRVTKVPNQFEFRSKAIILSNDELELTVIPQVGGGIARIRDLQTGMELGRGRLLFLPSGARMDAAINQYPGANSDFKVESSDKQHIKMTGVYQKWKIDKTISLSSKAPSFSISTTGVVESPASPSVTGAFMTRLKLSPGLGGKVEDCYFVYRDGKGQMHVEPARNPWECKSSGWGPTGMIAVVNPKTNKGFVWELSTQQNGGWYKIYPSGGHRRQNEFCFDLYGQRARIGKGETVRHEEKFTILRDARTWCEKMGVTALIPAWSCVHE